ncbi:hypothetical protein E6H26_04490, partial [Candidatus Bathyarchaeota archaeon]
DTLREYASKLQSNSVPLEELVITRSLSKNPGEYSHKVLQAIAAQLLKNEGGSVHAGQQVSYVMTIDSSNRKMTTAAPPELVDDNTIINLQGYVGLLISSAANLLLPLGYDKKSLTASLA